MKYETVKRSPKLEENVLLDRIRPILALALVCMFDAVLNKPLKPSSLQTTGKQPSLLYLFYTEPTNNRSLNIHSVDRG